MFAKLTGILDSIGDDWAVVDVGGVGYMVFCSARTLAQLPACDEAVSFVIETHIREDHIHLYGFLDQDRSSQASQAATMLCMQGGMRFVLSFVPPPPVFHRTMLCAQCQACLVP